MKEGERVCKFLKIFENFLKNLNDRKKMMGLNGFLKWFEIMTGGRVGEYGKMCPGKHIYITTIGIFWKMIKFIILSQNK